MKLAANRYYKHMGCLSRPDCRVASEVNHRVGEATSALRSISTTVLGAKALPQAVKLQAVNSFVLSRLVYNAGIWPELGRSELAKVQGVRTYAWRNVLGEHNVGRADGERSTDVEVRRRLRQCSARDLLAAQRLRHLRRLLVAAPDYLLGMVQSTSMCADSWAHMVFEDLRTMAERAQSFGGLLVATLPPPDRAYEAWRRFIVDRPDAWSSAILKLFVNHGGKFDPAADDPYLPQVLAGLGLQCPVKVFRCETCNKPFVPPQLPQHSRVQCAWRALQDSRQA